jgi:hypothetical protein
MALINVSICLSDIPKEQITVSKKNGKKYLAIVIADKREKDEWGNDTTVYISQTKEQRASNVQKVYIGNGKKIEFNGGNNAAPLQNQNTAPQQPAPQQNDGFVDDLPF